jgi:hypothetical protein
MTLFNDVNDPVIKVIDPNKDYYVELVGEDKPFKTNQDLAKAKAESDAFIENLKNENKVLRQQATEQITMKEFLTKLETAPKVKGDDNVNNQNADKNQPNNNENNDNQNNRTISEEDIVRVLETREATKTKRENLDSVKTVLQKAWGSNYPNILQEKTAEMGVSKEFLDNMAATSPRAFLKLLDVEASMEARNNELSVFAPRSGSVNTQAQNQKENSSGPKTFKEFKKLYKDPRDFYTGKVQNAMARTIKEVGEERFYS